MVSKLLCLVPALFWATTSAQIAGRIKDLFDTHQNFDEDLLIKIFREKPEEEFLLSETKDLIMELTFEFGDWIQSESFGELTHQGRQMDLISFK